MTREALAQAISDAAPIAPPRIPNAEEIVKATSRAFGVDVDAICGPSMSPPVCAARHVAAALLYALTTLSHQEVGDVIDRERTSVFYAVQKVQKDPRLASWAAAIRKTIDEGATDG